MTDKQAVPLVIHGWTIFAHPLFLAQVEALAQQVETLRQKDPVAFKKKMPQSGLLQSRDWHSILFRRIQRALNIARVIHLAMTISIGFEPNFFSSIVCSFAIMQRAKCLCSFG